MYAEVRCPECQQRLRVPTDQVGSEAICAICKAKFVIGSAVASPADAAAANPYAAPGPVRMRNVRPHRGGIVLALAIIGWTVCPVLSVVAWIMGRNDVAAMNRGAMDDSGRSVTQAGTTLALVHIGLMILGFILFLVIAAVGGVAALSA